MGFILFKACGPMTAKKDRIDLLTNGLVKQAGRKQSRKEAKNEKDGARDYEAGNSGERGMSLGATYKDVAIIASQKRKLDQNDHANFIARITVALNAKNSRWKSTLESIKLLRDIGQMEEAQTMAKELSVLSNEVKDLEAQLESLKKTETVDTNSPIDLYLQKGYEAMGLKTPNAPKKLKSTKNQCGLEDLTNNEGNDSDSDAS